MNFIFNLGDWLVSLLACRVGLGIMDAGLVSILRVLFADDAASFAASFVRAQVFLAGAVGGTIALVYNPRCRHCLVEVVIGWKCLVPTLGTDAVSV